MAINQNSIKLLDYLKANDGANLTASDVADALSIPKKTIEGCFTSAIQRKGLGIRVPAEVELSDGSHKTVKFLQLTEAGKIFDPAEAVAVVAE